MNSEIPTLPNTSEPQTKENKKGLSKVLASRQTWLSLLEVGIIEVLFVGIVIILLFGTLNYFNILRLSETLPNQLGFLPHRPYEQSEQFNNLTIAPTIAPPISPTLQTKQALINALPNILATSLIPNPSQITIEQDKGLGKAFVGSWDIKESTVAAIFVITDNKSISQLYLSFQRPQTTPPSVKLASTITSELFSIKPKGKWGCKPLYNNTMTYCENFWEENDGTRKGLGMEGLFAQGTNTIGGQPKAMLIFCEHTKDSKLYSWKSCQFEFAKTGVQ